MSGSTTTISTAHDLDQRANAHKRVQQDPSLGVAQQPQTEKKDDRPLFYCKVRSVATVITLLSTLYVEKGITVYVTVMPVSLRFTITKDKNLRARVYLKLPSFTQYVMRNETSKYTFAVNLGILLQCLQVFGVGLPPTMQGTTSGRPWQQYSSNDTPQHASLEMTYAAVGGPLHLKITDEATGAVTECNIRTLDISNEDEGLYDTLNFKSCPVIAKIVLPSAFLRDTLAAADGLAGATTFTLTVRPDTSAAAATATSGSSSTTTPQQPLVSVSAQGTAGRISYDLPTVGRGGVFTTFECTKAATVSYPLALIKACARAMARSENSMLRVNERGTLALHHMVPPIGIEPTANQAAQRKDNGGEDKSNWIEFVVAACEIE